MPAEPSIEGLPDVGDRQQIWWGRYGTPSGTPAVVLHGGPGSGCPDQWAWFDLDRADVVLVDQRQCGRSRPHASEPITDLSANTTAHLVTDLERLRASRTSAAPAGPATKPSQRASRPPRRGRRHVTRCWHDESMSSTPRPDPDDLPDSLPDDAAEDVQRQNEAIFTAETPERRQQSDAPTARRPGSGDT
jgi:hypothetical protein